MASWLPPDRAKPVDPLTRPKASHSHGRPFQAASWRLDAASLKGGGNLAERLSSGQPEQRNPARARQIQPGAGKPALP